MNEERKDDLLEKIVSEEEIEADPTLPASVNNPLRSEDLEKLIHDHDIPKLSCVVEEYDPHTVAMALNPLSSEDMVYFFRALPSDLSAEVFTLLDQEEKERLIQAFGTEEIQKLVDGMSTDNVVDFVDDLPANLVNKVLKSASKEDKERINTYLRFKEDSAGTLMTPEYLSFNDDTTVEKAIAEIRRIGKDMETIWMLFVTDNTRRLVGTIRLDHLLEADRHDVLRSIMNTDYVDVTVDTDEEDVLRSFRKYDISVMPVTNATGRMVGIITFDDVMDVATIENSEDIALQAAVTPSETPYMKRTVLGLVKGYAIWILVLLMLNTFTSSTLSYLQGTLSAIPLLTAFVPTVMGTNGNASDQTCTMITRELALGNISTKTYFKTVFKEFKASLITAIIMAVCSFGWILVELYSGIINLTGTDEGIIQNAYNGNTNALFLSVALLISLTFLIVIIIAKWLGASLPMLAKLVHIDPAVMSQPLISNVLDIISVCVYVLLANLIMQGLPPLFG